MERAKDLLESSFLSVKEIAFQVGLNDESHFVRDFKSTYGFSPALVSIAFQNNGTPKQHNGNGNGNGANQGEPSKADNNCSSNRMRKSNQFCRRCICSFTWFS